MDSGCIKQLGEFRIIREIGQGGMGIVYEAEQLRPKRRVALKILHKGADLDARALELFRREPDTAAKLSHPNIVSIYAVGQANGVHYFAMEYVEGETLARLIEETELKGKSTAVSDALVDKSAATDLIPPEEEDADEDDCDPSYAGSLNKEHFNTIARHMISAAEALDYAHRHGIIHRDVKPSNLMLTDEGRILVMDFGLAKEEGAARTSQTDHPVGTPWYMSPEQINPRTFKVDKRTDIYSLGVTLYQLLTLRLPFPRNERERVFNQIMFKDPPRPRKLVPQLPRDLETIALKAMEKDPDRRYESAQGMADDLQRYLKDEPVWAKPPTLCDRMAKAVKRNKMTAGAIAVSFALMLSVVSVFGYLLYVSEKKYAESEKERAEALVRGVITIAQGLVDVESYEHAYKSLRLGLRQAPDNREIKRLIDSITGSISFTTTPEHASVYLSYINPVTTEIAKEREPLGKSPCIGEHVLFGEYKVDIEKDGYGTMEFLVNIEAGKKVEIRKTLTGRDDLPDRFVLRKGRIICERDGAEMVFVPAGGYPMGSGRHGDPAGICAYYINKYEVTNAQYKRFLDWIERTEDHSKCHVDEAPGKDHTPDLWDDEEFNDPRQPVVGVDWYDAYGYAAWAGGALPCEDEWEKAARGETDYTFPWGHCEPNARRAIYGAQRLSEVGACPAGISPYGCYDMSGNVGEWCMDQRERLGELKDPAGLVQKIRSANDPLSQWLRGRLSSHLRQLLDKYDGDGPPSQLTQGTLKHELDMLIQGDCLYDEQRFAHVALSDSAQKLIQRKQRGNDLSHLNRLLLEEAYSDEIAKKLVANRIARNAGWGYLPFLIRCSSRMDYAPTRKMRDVGFRCVKRCPGKGLKDRIPKTDEGG